MHEALRLYKQFSAVLEFAMLEPGTSRPPHLREIWTEVSRDMQSDFSLFP